jgi:hypothetical protein
MAYMSEELRNETRYLLTSNEWETDADMLQLTEVTR